MADKKKGFFSKAKNIIFNIKNFCLKNGMIGSMIEIIKFLFGIICFFSFGKKLKDKLDAEKSNNKNSKKIYNTQERLLEEWKIKWTFSDKKLICTFLKEDLFLEIFVNNYNFIKYKKEINQEKNFSAKKIYTGVWLIESIIFVLLIGYVVFQVTQTASQGNIALDSMIKIIIENGIVGIQLYIFPKIVAKWIGIKKYQETWIRHEAHIYEIQKQMLLYIQDMAPYDVTDANEKNEKFKEKTIEIWDKNQEKFIDNMENKETSL